MNSALLAKQAWRLYQQTQSLWVKFPQAIYFPQEDFLRANKQKNSS